MIFSGINMIMRMMKEKDPNYTDIGLGFIIMGFMECIMWILLILIFTK